MSLGKSQLLLPVQPRVFATTNHLQEMLWSPTPRALDELELEDSGAGEAELVFSRSHASVFGLFILFHISYLGQHVHQRRSQFVSVVSHPRILYPSDPRADLAPQAIESFTGNESPLSRGDFKSDFNL